MLLPILYRPLNWLYSYFCYFQVLRSPLNLCNLREFAQFINSRYSHPFQKRKTPLNPRKKKEETNGYHRILVLRFSKMLTFQIKMWRYCVVHVWGTFLFYKQDPTKSKTGLCISYFKIFKKQIWICNPQNQLPMSILGVKSESGSRFLARSAFQLTNQVVLKCTKCLILKVEKSKS